MKRGKYKIEDWVTKLENQQEELYKASLPLLEFLNKHYNPYAYAIVTEGNVEIVTTEMTVKLPVRD